MSTAADMAVAMPVAVDGPPVESITGKRKRADDEGDAKPARDQPAGDAPSAVEPQRLNQFLGDLLEILKTYVGDAEARGLAGGGRSMLTLVPSTDTEPSILSYPLTSASEDVPSAKRTKVSSSAKATKSIQGKIASSAYSDVDELTRDVATAAEAISEAENGRVAGRLVGFRSLYDGLIARQKAQDASGLFERLEDEAAQIDEAEDIQVDTAKPTASAISFAGPGGRPYFSSLRDPVASQAGDVENAEEDPLEALLPKGMWTSTVIPVRHHDEEAKPDKLPTLGDICPAPAHLKPLEPPRDSPLATTRGSTVGWYAAERLPTARVRLGGRSSYSNQRLRTGAWLSTVNPPARQANPLGERPKTKDTSAGGTDAQAEQTDEEREKARLAKRKSERDRNRATFRKVYSSFAPSFDNTGSVVPQEQRRQFWWSKKKLLRAHRQSLGADDFDVDSMEQNEHSEIVLDEALLEEAVQAYEEDDVDPWVDVPDNANKTQPLAAADTDTEVILTEISEMIETLSSHQRIRHVELKSKGSSSSEFGSASQPSAAEFDLHTMLRDQLAVLVASLPPFAVARLDGDRLSELNISPLLELGADSHRGILDDDTKPSVPQAGAAGQRLPVAGAARPGAFPGVAGSPAARAAYSAPRPPSGYYPGRVPPAGAGSYSTYQHHPGQPPRAQPPQYAQSPLAAQSAAQADGRPSALPNGYLSHGAASPIPGRTVQYPGAGMQAYQSRPLQGPPNAVGYPVPGGRGVTPPQMARPGYPPTAQMSPPLHGPVQYHGSPPRVTSLANGVGAAGPPISMSPEARAMLARQAAQQQSQSPPVQAQTPYAPPPKYQSPGKPVVTPAQSSASPPPASASAPPVPEQE